MTHIADIAMSEQVSAIQNRQLNPDFYFLTPTGLKSKPYRPDFLDYISEIDPSIPESEVNLDPTKSQIQDIKEICIVKQNAMIVFGTRRGQPGYAFELLLFKDLHRTTIFEITTLKFTLELYLMHSCDFGGGAYFRSTELREQHVFYDSVSNRLLSRDSPVVNNLGYKLVRVINSRRGDYLGVFYYFDTGNLNDNGIYLNMIQADPN